MFILLLLAAGVLLAHAIWRSSTGSYFQQQLDALRASGEPTTPQDFVIVDVDSPENGGIDIEAAGKQVLLSTDEWKTWQKMSPELPLRAEERKAIAAILPVAVKLDEHLKRAKSKPRLERKYDVSLPLLDRNDAGLSQLRELANIQASLALLAHENGNDAEAVDRIENILLLSRYSNTNPSLLGHLVALGIAALAADAAADIAPDLRIGNQPAEASPECVRKLIAQLADPVPMADGFQLAMRGERVVQQEMLQELFGGETGTPNAPAPRSVGKAVGAYFVKPIADKNASLMLDNMAKVLDASDEANWPAAKAKMPVAIEEGQIYLLARMLVSSLDRAIETHFKCESERRLAAAALAIRLYAAEHDGASPQTLQELVPANLPVLPVDPFLATGEPLRYRPAGNAPILYSVGLDGVDDGGSEVLEKPHPEWSQEPPNRWAMKDRVLHLNRQPRFVPPEDVEPSTTPAGASTLPAQ